MKNISIIIEALHNYGYHCINNKNNNIIFAKPIGYSFIKAEIIPGEPNTELELSLIVKGNNGRNMLWTSEINTVENIIPDEKYYMNVVKIIIDFEASILKVQFALEINRNKRFDFVENTKCVNKYIFE